MTTAEIAAAFAELKTKLDPDPMTEPPIVDFEAKFYAKTKAKAEKFRGKYMRTKGDGRLCLLYPIKRGGIAMKFADNNPPPKL
jgi:hypothetical protein